MDENFDGFTQFENVHARTQPINQIYQLYKAMPSTNW